MKTPQIAVRVVATVALIAAALAGAGLLLAEKRRDREIPIQVAAPVFHDSADSVERGRYLFNSRGCIDCHGADGGGRVFVDDGALRVRGPDITLSRESSTSRYSPHDWARAIRHGVKPNHRPLLFMPSQDYNRLTNDDLAALVAYVRQLPPAAGGPAEVRLPLLARIMYGYGLIPDAASIIDHSLPVESPVPSAVSVGHGRYVGNMCIGCHGAELTGGRIPGAPPDWPDAPSLTPGAGSAMQRYPDEHRFIAMLRSGKRPDGSAIAVMPFESLSQLSDEDARALHLYLRSLPVPTATD